MICEACNYRSIVIPLDQTWSLLNAIPIELVKDISPLKH